MIKKQEGTELSKPTYEATLSCQIEIRHILKKHIENNTPLSAMEKERFFVLFPSSTLGEGSATKFSIPIENRIYNIKSVELAARWLADQDGKRVFIPERFGFCSSPMVDISVLWSALLEHLYLIFPVSLSKALSMSKEDTRSQQSNGYQVS